MPQTRPSILERALAAAWRRPWLWGWIAASAALVPLLSFRGQSELTGCYLPAAARVIEGQPLPGPEAWVYPPFFALPVLPLVWVPVPVARVAWCALLVGCAVLSARSIWNTLMLDDAFRQAVKVPWRFFVFVGSLAAGAGGHALVPLGYQSHDLIVMALVCAGAWQGACAFDALRDRPNPARERSAGVRFGLAASCKVMPALFLPALVAERRWRAAAWMGLTGLACAVAFDALAWACTGRAHFLAWLRLASGGSDLTASGGGRWGAWNPLNQSGTGILTRLMVPTPPELGLDHECMVVAVSEAGRRAVLGTWVALVVGAVMVCAWRTSLAPRMRFGQQGCSPPMHALASAGAVACAYLLIAPHTSNYHFAPVAIASAAMLGWMLTRGRDMVMLACLAIAIGIELTPGRDVLGGRLADIKLAYGSVGVCALAGLVGSMRVMACSARQGRASIGWVTSC